MDRTFAEIADCIGDYAEKSVFGWMPVREVSRMLGTSAGTIAWRLH